MVERCIIFICGGDEGFVMVVMMNFWGDDSGGDGGRSSDVQWWRGAEFSSHGDEGLVVMVVRENGDDGVCGIEPLVLPHHQNLPVASSFSHSRLQ